MTRKTFLFLIVTILAIALFVMVFKEKTNLISPVNLGRLQTKQTPVPLATPAAPKTFQFDKTTDLKLELEKVDPKVLDSDFD
ncbi:hypothetical protein HYW43_01100 [Candidatus Daviesbacteria bacterium]|nr:hypothetical protein [Candidatus Daviesbacteria bacterium]